MSIGGLIILWIACAVILPPLIQTLGLNRSHREDASLPPGQLESVLTRRFTEAFEYIAWVAGTLGFLYLTSRDPEPGGLMVLVWSIGYVVVFAIAGIVGSMLPSGSGRRGYHVALLVVGAVGLVTFLADRAAAKAAAAEYAAAVREHLDMEIRIRQQWLGDLRLAGAEGPAGTEPPMLLVGDTGRGVLVTNIGTKTITLEMWRRPADPTAWAQDNCQLWSARMRDQNHQLKPDETQWIPLDGDPAYTHSCRNLPVSFKVGNYYQPGVGWWSQRQIAEFERELQEIRADRERGTSSRIEVIRPSLEQLREWTRDTGTHQRDPGRAQRWQSELEESRRRKSAIPREAHVAHLARARELETQSVMDRELQHLQRLQNQREHERGIAPHYLNVQESGPTVSISHGTNALFDVRVSRVGIGDDGGITSRCEYAPRDDAQPGGFARVSPNRPVLYRLGDGGSCADPGQTILQLEVRDHHGATVWLSEHLLNEELERARQRASGSREKAP